MRYIFKEEREREREKKEREGPDTFKIRKKWLR